MKNSLCFFEILHFVQNDTAREFVILNRTLCSEVSHSANKWIFHLVQNDTAREFVILNGTLCSEVSHSANKWIFRFAQNDSNAVFFCALLFRGLKSAVYLFNMLF